MPTKLPAKLTPTPVNPEWAKSHSFFSNRWCGTPEALQHAEATRDALRSRGLLAGIYTGTDRGWVKEHSKYTEYTYYKVFVNKDDDSLYYAWFRPKDEKEFCAEPDFSQATWFEFARSTGT